MDVVLENARIAVVVDQLVVSVLRCAPVVAAVAMMVVITVLMTLLFVVPLRSTLAVNIEFPLSDVPLRRRVC